VIRRLIVAATIVLGVVAVPAQAHAAVNIACAWNEIPLHTGICLAL
jgi:hypothetical protein